jgi:DNA-binding IclR family transcriptional regulator
LGAEGGRWTQALGVGAASQDLDDATRETAHLAVLDGPEALYVEHLSGRASVPLVSTAGTRLPLHATAVGKVLLAHATRELQDCVLAQLPAITTHTVVDPSRLRASWPRSAAAATPRQRRR